MAVLNNAPVIIGGSDHQHLFIGAMPSTIPADTAAFATAAFTTANKVTYGVEFGDIDESKEKKEVPGLWQTSKEYIVAKKSETADIEATVYVTDDEYAKYRTYFTDNTQLIVGIEETADDDSVIVKVGFAAMLSKCTLTNVGKDNEFLQVKITITPSGDVLDLKTTSSAPTGA